MLPLVFVRHFHSSYNWLSDISQLGPFMGSQVPFLLFVRPCDEWTEMWSLCSWELIICTGWLLSKHSDSLMTFMTLDIRDAPKFQATKMAFLFFGRKRKTSENICCPSPLCSALMFHSLSLANITARFDAQLLTAHADIGKVCSKNAQT